MNIQRLCLIYFSPTGTTKKVLQRMAKEIDLPVTYYDLTNYKSKDIKLSLSETDLVVFAYPVYSGRVPATFNERLKGITGNNTAMAMVATYGNREYDDALLEMKDIMEPAGFKAIGAVAIVTEHSVVRSIATGRPNKEDEKIISEFGRLLFKKVTSISDLSKEPELIVKGNRPYRKYMKIPMSPKSTSECTKCAMCCNTCPTGAIDKKIHTNKQLCVGCMRCVRICPHNARSVGYIKNWGAARLLNSKCKGDKQPEIFL